jgi:uncharacterized membrane protein
MSPILSLSIATLLVALLATASAVALVRRRPGAGFIAVSKESIRRAFWLTMVLGFVELCALLALIAAFLEQPSGSRPAWLAAGAFICVAMMGGVWLTWIMPVNASPASTVSSEEPEDTSPHRTRGFFLHAVRLVLALLALFLLVTAVLAKPLR